VALDKANTLLADTTYKNNPNSVFNKQVKIKDPQLLKAYKKAMSVLEN
jgi:hypothetical protein